MKHLALLLLFSTAAQAASPIITGSDPGVTSTDLDPNYPYALSGFGTYLFRIQGNCSIRRPGHTIRFKDLRTGGEIFASGYNGQAVPCIDDGVKNTFVADLDMHWVQWQQALPTTYDPGTTPFLARGDGGGLGVRAYVQVMEFEPVDGARVGADKAPKSFVPVRRLGYTPHPFVYNSATGSQTQPRFVGEVFAQDGVGKPCINPLPDGCKLEMQYSCAPGTGIFFKRFKNSVADGVEVHRVCPSYGWPSSTDIVLLPYTIPTNNTDTLRWNACAEAPSGPDMPPQDLSPCGFNMPTSYFNAPNAPNYTPHSTFWIGFGVPFANTVQ